MKGRGEKEKKDDVKSHQCKGSLPSPLSGTPLPIHPSLSTLPRVKQFCCCLVDLSPAPHCLAKQAKIKQTFFLAKATLSLCGSSREQQGFRQNQSIRHRNWPNQLAEPAGRTENKTENQFSVCRTNFQFAHVRVYFDPARSKP